MVPIVLKFIRNKYKQQDKSQVKTPIHNNNHDKPQTEATQGIFGKLANKLRGTRTQFTDKLFELFSGRKVFDTNRFEEFEDLLLSSDVGVETTEQIITTLSQNIKRQNINDPQVILSILRQQLLDILTPCEKPLTISSNTEPFVILIVGVNGAGKTTTIGKLAKTLQVNGKKILLAAGDTFRAAAVEQLKILGKRNKTPVIAQQTGADSASVIYDALQAAKARKFDMLIADTAGRLHTQDNLMKELKKIVLVLKKIDPNAPHEILLVLDASIGQNTLIQAEKFHQAVGINGLVLTKLDGTAKGGIIFAIAKKLKLPIRYIGIGEGIDDFRPFQAKLFIDVLFKKHPNK